MGVAILDTLGKITSKTKSHTRAKMGVSMRLANFGRKPLDFTLKLFYGNSVVGVGYLYS